MRCRAVCSVFSGQVQSGVDAYVQKLQLEITMEKAVI